MPADVSAITYFAPIAAFLIVFAFVFAVLLKTKILGEHKIGTLVVAFIIATLFVSAAGAISYIKTIVPWFAVLIVSLVFLMILSGFIGKPVEFMNKGIGIAFIIIFALVFLISGFIIFSSSILPYLPGPGFGTGDSIETTIALDYLYSPRVAGAILLVAISAVVAWVLVKAK
jgi:hypothetical protein